MTPRDEVPSPRPIDEARRTFIERWTAMAASWGVTRSMAEVHALLFAEGRAMSADEIMARLGISRGNASMTVRTLVEWGIVRRLASEGSRRELYEAEQDVVSLFATVIRVRKQREIDPLLELVRSCRDASGPCSGPEAESLSRKLDDIELFVRATDRLCDELLGSRERPVRSVVEHYGARR